MGKVCILPNDQNPSCNFNLYVYSFVFILLYTIIYFFVSILKILIQPAGDMIVLFVSRLHRPRDFPTLTFLRSLIFLLELFMWYDTIF